MRSLMFVRFKVSIFFLTSFDYFNSLCWDCLANGNGGSKKNRREPLPLMYAFGNFTHKEVRPYTYPNRLDDALCMYGAPMYYARPGLSG